MTYPLSEWLNVCTFPPSLSLTVSLIVNKSWITQLCTRRAVNREHRSPKRRGNAVLLTNCALFDYIISGVEWNKRWKVECSGIWENKRHGGEGDAQHDQSQSQVAAEIVVQVHRQFFVELIIKNMWKGYPTTGCTVPWLSHPLAERRILIPTLIAIQSNVYLWLRATGLSCAMHGASWNWELKECIKKYDGLFGIKELGRIIRLDLLVDSFLFHLQVNDRLRPIAQPSQPWCTLFPARQATRHSVFPFPLFLSTSNRLKLIPFESK